jgi:hypothetical protein
VGGKDGKSAYNRVGDIVPDYNVCVGDAEQRACRKALKSNLDAATFAYSVF